MVSQSQSLGELQEGCSRALAALGRQGRRLRAAGEITGWRRLPWISPLWLVVKRYRVVAWDTADGSLPKAGFPAGTGRQRISADNAGWLTACNPEWRRNLIERRLRAGCQGYLWSHHGRLVHARWQSAGKTWLPYLSIGFEPRPGDLLSVEAYTPQSCRRQGFYAAGLAWMLAEARRMGSRRCVFLTAWWNRPILGLLERLGARRVGEVDMLQLGSLRRHRARGKARRCSRSTFSVEG